jgi:hypothetical protein
MLENIKKNLQAWDQTYAWPKDGDEWDGQAALCGVPYPTWKESLAHHLLAPHVSKKTHVLEIAPGHGRWTEYLVKRPVMSPLSILVPPVSIFAASGFKLTIILTMC